MGLMAITGGLAAFAASQEWLNIGLPSGQVSADLLAGVVGGSPMASAMSWVLLAAWGALLVTRGAVRRAMVVVGLAASIACVVATINWGARSTSHAAQTLSQVGVTEFEAGLTAWFWLGLVSASLTVVVGVAALGGMATWPAMGKRYDAPESPAGPSTAVDLTSGHDVWKAIDEGRDPTSYPHA